MNFKKISDSCDQYAECLFKMPELECKNYARIFDNIILRALENKICSDVYSLDI